MNQIFWLPDNVLVLVISVVCFLFYCIWNIRVDDFHRGISLNPHLVKSWIWYWNFGKMRLPNSLEILHPEIAVVHWIAKTKNSITAEFCLSLVFAWVSIYTWHERAIYRKLRKELSPTIRTESLRKSVKRHYSVVTCWAFCCHIVDTGLEPRMGSDTSRQLLERLKTILS